MTKQYDVVVIGGGPGGYVAAIRSAQLGLKTACIDKGEYLGGTCLNVGCIPSKALLHSSQQYHFIQKEAAAHGINVQNAQVDLAKMMQRKQDVVKGLVQSIAALLKKHQIDWLQGTGKVTGPNTISVNGETVEAANIILATGSEPIPLPFLPFDEKRVVSSTGALSLPQVPAKMIVVGAGVIGVELASVYSRLGTEVNIVEMLETICPTMDHSVCRSLQTSLKKQGLNFHLGVKVVAGKVTDKDVTLTIERDGKPETFVADVVLVAIGRRPYSQSLGLTEAGVAMTPKGFVVVDELFRTNVNSIYAIGDLIEGPMLAHKASEEGTAVAEIIAGHRPKVTYISIPNIVYTHPEAAAIGLTEAEAKQAGFELLIGSCIMKGNARARSTAETDGLVKVIGDKKTGRLLGMHIVASTASEMIGEGVIAMNKGATLEEIAEASHGHPTLSESIKEACLQALGKAIHV
ncbi:MAG: dihydrolipoyl dehydrogenase [Chlamydiales bacterium]|nr:dihydrolipoyl dehydrogenase [Chlamydiales bacterium]